MKAVLLNGWKSRSGKVNEISPTIVGLFAMLTRLGKIRYTVYMNEDIEVLGLRLVAAHNNNVQKKLAGVISNLAKRMADHDQSKYSVDELSLVLGKPTLDTLEYNSDEYKLALARVQEGVSHHYASNSHHPEHYGIDGIKGMTLLDLLEMACDWAAAATEHDSTYLSSINYNVERFGLSVEIQEILQNTGRELGWI